MIASIPSPPTNGFAVGPFEIHLYGLTYAVAIAVGVWITIRRWEARGGSRDLVYDVILWAIPAGVIGGRIYFDITSSSEIPPHWWGPFAVWDGGLGSWGAFSLAILVAAWRIRRANASVALALDAAVPGLLVAQGIGRLGNYFNQELFGAPTSLPWGLQIEPSHRPAGYAQYSTFEPTFLYELISDFALAGFLVWLGKRREIKPPGIFALYVAGYSAFRVFEETQRIDPAHHFFGLRLNVYVASAVMIAGLIWFARTQGWTLRRKQEVAPPEPATPERASP